VHTKTLDPKPTAEIGKRLAITMFQKQGSSYNKGTVIGAEHGSSNEIPLPYLFAKGRNTLITKAGKKRPTLCGAEKAKQRCPSKSLQEENQVAGRVFGRQEKTFSERKEKILKRREGAWGVVLVTHAWWGKMKRLLNWGRLFTGTKGGDMGQWEDRKNQREKFQKKGR